MVKEKEDPDKNPFIPHGKAAARQEQDRNKTGTRGGKGKIGVACN